jgi:hypothetical protein
VPLQTWLAPQTFVQLPQWVASEATHEPQSSVPLGQEHEPVWQVRPPPQGMPQSPQLFESTIGSTHWEPQSFWPAVQLVDPPVPPPPLVPAVPGLLDVAGEQAARNAKPSPARKTLVAVFIFMKFPAGL